MRAFKNEVVFTVTMASVCVREREGVYIYISWYLNAKVYKMKNVN